MSGIQDIPIRAPAEWDPKWFEGWVRDALRLGDTRNALGIDILVSGDSDVVATYAVDSQNVDLAEGLETRAILGAMRARIDELELQNKRAIVKEYNLKKRIKQLELDVA